MRTLEVVVAASVVTAILLLVVLDPPRDLQSLGMPELIIIFVMALHLFGPRGWFRQRP